MRFLIDELRAMQGHEHLWLCVPAPAFENHWGIVPDVLAQEIVPLVRRLARELGISLIDLWEPLIHRPELFPDHVHPGPEACAIIAQQVYAALNKP
jgi:sialate O-acetylesterase